MNLYVNNYKHANISHHNNKTQREIKFNRALNGFREAIENSYRGDPWKKSFELKEFLNLAFKPREDNPKRNRNKGVMNANKLVNAARLGSEAYPVQARKILKLNSGNISNISYIPAVILAAIAEGLGPGEENRRVKKRALMAIQDSYGNIYNPKETNTIIRGLTHKLTDQDIRNLMKNINTAIKKTIDENNGQNLRWNNNINLNKAILNQLRAQLAARSRARNMVERLRNRQVSALNGSRPNLNRGVLELIRRKM